jgi:hypothetical protein
MTIITGDFNSKVGKQIGTETCIGNWSRGRRNKNGSSLVEFCEKNNKVIANSCFQHPARHITTWSQTRSDKNTGKPISIYNQIDYIIMDQNNKQVLTDARSYSGTETFSDHRLVVARMEVIWPKIYQKRRNTAPQKRFDTGKLVANAENQNEYKDQIQRDIATEQYAESLKGNKWENIKNIIRTAAEKVIGYKQKTTIKQINDTEIEKLSTEQNQIKLQINNCKDSEKIKELRKARKALLKQTKTKVKEANEKRIDELIAEVENAKDDTRMFKAVKALTTKHQKINFVHDENQHCVSQPQEMQRIIENTS